MQRRTKLLLWRLTKKLKQKDVCESMKISAPHYSNIERGSSDPSYEILMNFRKAYPNVNDVLGLFEKGVDQNGDSNTSRVID